MSSPSNISPEKIDVLYRRTAETAGANPAEATAGVEAETRRLGALSDDERERYGKLKVAAARENFLVAHVLLRNGLSRRAPLRPAEWQFETGAHGKPLIANAGYREKLSFSLSHTQGMVACAVAAAPVVALGVDIECLDRKIDWEPLARRYYAPGDLAWIHAGDASQRRERFFRLWTLKEAYLKATGAGFSQPLSSFSFDFADAQRPRLLKLSEPSLIESKASRPSACERLFFESRPAPNYVLATAALFSGEAPVIALRDAGGLET